MGHVTQIWSSLGRVTKKFEKLNQTKYGFTRLHRVRCWKVIDNKVEFSPKKSPQNQRFVAYFSPNNVLQIDAKSPYFRSIKIAVKSSKKNSRRRMIPFWKSDDETYPMVPFLGVSHHFKKMT